ncbi:hypothetical protein [Latilactobacillus fuchuensis]|uniref:DUF4760 domain-containing protein n=1 Tax=Latilactobacillus fuchuensis TaxID=164393 RepID=UPI0039AF2234
MWSDIEWVSNIKLALSLLASITTIVGIIALFFTIKQYKQNAKNREIDIQMRKTDYDLVVLTHFSENIIKKTSKFHKKLKNETNTKEFRDMEDNKKKKEILINIKLRLGIIHIFNLLEKEALYITSDITHEQVLYNIVGGIVCEFMVENLDVFDRVTSERAPYDNLNEILERWCLEKDIDHLNGEKELINEKIKNLKRNRKKSFSGFE